MIPDTLSFVDVETTGLSPTRDRVIEIGIVRVEKNRIVKTLNQLINPEMAYSPYIQSLTGITYDQLENAPLFSDMVSEIERMIDGAVFVAHNARFDFGFLRNEFKRCGRSFSPKQLCTARLSRKLYSHIRRHSLESIIARYGFTYTNRHRAYDDAHVLWQFYQHVLDSFPHDTIAHVIANIQKKPTLPKRLDPAILDDLPETSGIYYFYDKNKTLLYIGKSTNIRSRVLSHFSSDYLSSKQMSMVKHIAHIDYEITAGELGALIRESYLIKQHAPLFNRQLRRTAKLIVAQKITRDDGYDSVVLESVSHIDPNKLENLMGIFPSKKRAKAFLEYLQEKYSLCSRMLELQSGTGSCFSYHLESCNGACISEESAQKYNMRFLLAFAENRIKPWYFDTPVTIQEVNKEAKLAETFTLDKWCLVDHETTSDTQSAIPFERAFDRDIYKILVRRLAKKGLS